ncbi:hypothetical protein BC827DRAFT_1176066 [Russula dissimulans]|nr:hypothetical protein BC827DRAFT_1176066 [Russula dissimulans]
MSSFQERPNHAVKARKVTGPQRCQETQDTPGSNQWFCPHGDCDKTYGRLQELKRHIRDKHNIPRKCPFCDTTWTRPETIRGHLVVQHQDHLTEEECDYILKLRGREGTIHFLKKLGRWEVS